MTDNAKKLGDEILGAGRKLYLFGIGTVAAAGDEASKLFSRMVARGEDAAKSVHEDRDSLVAKVQGTVSGTLARAGVPRRSEIQDLIARVEDLTQKVEALSDRNKAE